MCGHTLRLPHSKALGAGLFELREKRFGLRLYYCFDSFGGVLLLHGDDKDSQEKDIKQARKKLAMIRRSYYEKEKF